MLFLALHNMPLNKDAKQLFEILQQQEEKKTTPKDSLKLVLYLRFVELLGTAYNKGESFILFY